MATNILAIVLLIGGGYGIKSIFEQRQDIRDSRIKQEELLTNQQKNAQGISESLQKEEEKEKEENQKNLHRDFTKLKEQNSDVVAWLYVPGTDIDLPIVKTKDNSFYLTHDFDKKTNTMGWAFADYQNTFPQLSTNTIMYGHTYKMTTIFSKLKNVLTDSWQKDEDNYLITFDTEKERLKFRIFSIYTIKETSDYLQIGFSSKEKYQQYLNQSVKRSIKNFKSKPTTDDKILTLSTCYIDAHQRLVVQAKLIGSE